MQADFSYVLKPMKDVTGFYFLQKINHHQKISEEKKIEAGSNQDSSLLRADPSLLPKGWQLIN
jgi:hypothetical protein